MPTFIWFIILHKYERRTSDGGLISQETWQYFISLPCWVACNDVIAGMCQSVQMY